jgi:hypothetical protein
MTFLCHIEVVISKSSRMLGFIKRLSREFSKPYIYKMLYVSLLRINLEYAVSVWSKHQEIHSAKVERIQHSFVRFALRGLGQLDQLAPAWLTELNANRHSIFRGSYFWWNISIEFFADSSVKFFLWRFD